MKLKSAATGLILFGLAGFSASAFAVGVAAADPWPNRDPVVFLKETVAQIARNDYAAAWQTLNPAHQQVAPFGEYVACELASPVPGHLDWIRVLRARSGRLVVPGTREPVAVMAATLRLQISDESLGASVRITHTVHAVAVRGRWTWILPAHRYELYRDDACGVTPQLPS